MWVRRALVILLEPMQALVLAAAWLYARVLVAIKLVMRRLV